MYHLPVSRIPRSLRVVAAIAVVAVVLGSIPRSRHAVLRAAGRALVAEDPIRAADVIVVAVDAREAGVLEAADLVRSGVSHAVALFDDGPDDVDREFARRGVDFQSQASRLARLLRALGVDHVELIPVLVAGTEDEGRLFPGWCEERGYHSVIVVTSTDHTRRLRRVFHRAMKGHSTTVMIRRVRYSGFDPETWWRTRDGIRTEIVEFEKLLVDFVRHPIS
jgi:hypothetical protein